MDTKTKKRTIRNLVIFTILVLGLAVLASVIEPFTVPLGAEPGTSGLGQLLWIIAPLVVMLLLRIFGGDGWDDHSRNALLARDIPGRHGPHPHPDQKRPARR